MISKPFNTTTNSCKIFVLFCCLLIYPQTLLACYQLPEDEDDINLGASYPSIDTPIVTAGTEEHCASWIYIRDPEKLRELLLKGPLMARVSLKFVPTAGELCKLVDCWRESLQALRCTDSGIIFTKPPTNSFLTDYELGWPAVCEDAEGYEIGENPEHLDLTALAGASNLRILSLRSSIKVEGVEALRDLTSLQTLCLNADGINIQDLFRLTQLRKLELLNLLPKAVSASHGVEGDSIPPLSGLRALTTIKIVSSAVENLTFLSGLPLENLTLIETQVGRLDTLEPVTSLRRLTITGSDVVYLDWLAKQPQLEQLTLDNNPISLLEPLSGLTNLTLLSIVNARIIKLNSLSTLIKLEELYLSQNAISSVEPLARLTCLRKLDLSSNAVTNVVPLVTLTALQVLQLNHNQITDCRTLQALPNLQGLNIDDNPVSQLNPMS